tara:strand:+ start:449 stop:637 length:189 start_codon:yes stop_codon:yes gene_type:complete
VKEKKSKKNLFAPGKKKYVFDEEADKFSGKKMAGSNPKGLQIMGGIAYEVITSLSTHTYIYL